MSNINDHQCSEPFETQPEYAGGGPGDKIRTAIGMFGEGSGIDPTLLKTDPPFWFSFIQRRVHKHYYRCLSEMPKTRTLQILYAAGLPPLCILTVGLRWNLLPVEDFGHLDLEAVFQTAGYEAEVIGKSLRSIETRSLFKLYTEFGIKNEAMLKNANISEMKRAED